MTAPCLCHYTKMAIDNILKNNCIIKILAVLLIVYGIIEILLGAKSIWFGITYIFYSPSINFVSILYVVGIPLFFILLIPAAAIAGGIGLYQKKKWGWILSIIISLTIFTIYCAGSINFLIASYCYRNIPMPSIPGGAHVEYSSMIKNSYLLLSV